ncbi:hypothetical protein A3C67_00800 [Candidatus Nomurabacteria bacterium RIFCSPHIGHO2_02_FULL_42_19]|uniref:Type IV pilus modification protein PilV n=1 Tax=Candidatus Nomurabacteria bacterium RIFCSPHIGHO2_02_FULL_42_19 TaxID=1801756 RepID=A0A1F6W121_9BACT|nr:MAG: hypothetical protein A3C67_00800 [Candidatus Nomurabacteria bacterium RIFCSPHIGHO2_02_FULL_42_19]
MKFFSRQQNRKKEKHHRGFSLIEMLVALAIFSTSVLVLLVVLGQSISDTGYAKKKNTAAYLAQEGIEYMRNLRDTYLLYSGTASAGWTAFNNNLTDASACQLANGCFFDDRNVSFSDTSMPMLDLLLTACTSSTCPNGALLYDSAIGKYGYVSGTSSVFTRQIKITQPTANETKVSSTVSWTQGSGTRSVTFSENLFKWIE